MRFCGQTALQMFSKVPRVHPLTYTMHGPWINPSRATISPPVKWKTYAVVQIFYFLFFSPFLSCHHYKPGNLKLLNCHVIIDVVLYLVDVSRGSVYFSKCCQCTVIQLSNYSEVHCNVYFLHACCTIPKRLANLLRFFQLSNCIEVPAQLSKANVNTLVLFTKTCCPIYQNLLS